jgi:hypothetical protein
MSATETTRTSERIRNWREWRRESGAFAGPRQFRDAVVDLALAALADGEHEEAKVWAALAAAFANEGKGS